MRITWKDGITTLTAAGAILIERAHFHVFNVPLVADARWALIGIGILAAVGYIFGYLMDETHESVWTVMANFLGVIMLGVVLLGLIVASSDFVVVLMLSTVVFWLISVVSHLMSTTHLSAGHHA